MVSLSEVGDIVQTQTALGSSSITSASRKNTSLLGNGLSSLGFDFHLEPSMLTLQRLSAGSIFNGDRLNALAVRGCIEDFAVTSIYILTRFRFNRSAFCEVEWLMWVYV